MISLGRMLPLAATLFAMMTGGMVMAGMLPDLAADLHVSESVAGQLITAYAIVSALGGPLLATLTARFRRRRLLIVLLAAYVVINAASAAAPNYPTLLATRVVAACASAGMFPVALATAAALAPPERRGRFMALVTSGATASLVLGAPIGTWLGGEYGWRAGVLFVAGAALAALLGMVMLPDVAGSAPLPVRERLAPLARPQLLRTFLATLAMMAGAALLTAYLRPLLRAASDAGHRLAALVLSLAGIAGLVGAWLGGRGIDRWSAPSVLRYAVAGHGVAIVSCGVLAAIGGMPIAASAAAVMGVSLCGWALNPALQIHLLDSAAQRDRASDAGSEVLAINGSVGQLGVAAAGALGGVLLAQLGPASLGFIGGALQFVALALLLGRDRPYSITADFFVDTSGARPRS